MEKEIIQYMEETAVKKSGLLRHSFPQYMLRSIIAGFIIGLGVVFSFTVGNMLSDVPGTMLFAGMAFSVALVFIIWMGGELFTSNTMYLFTGAQKKRVSWGDLVKVWSVSWIGNLIGALLLSIIVIGAHSLGDVDGEHLLMVVAAKKMGLDSLSIFLKAILCNVLVCMAVFMPLKTKNDAAKLILTMLPVVVFFTAGFEHSIANMGVFSLALAYSTTDAITVPLALHNLTFATLGNIVGGALFIAAAYVYLNNTNETDGTAVKKSA